MRCSRPLILTSTSVAAFSLLAAGCGGGGGSPGIASVASPPTTATTATSTTPSGSGPGSQVAQPRRRRPGPVPDVHERGERHPGGEVLGLYAKARGAELPRPQQPGCDHDPLRDGDRPGLNRSSHPPEAPARSSYPTAASPPRRSSRNASSRCSPSRPACALTDSRTSPIRPTAASNSTAAPAATSTRTIPSSRRPSRHVRRICHSRVRQGRRNPAAALAEAITGTPRRAVLSWRASAPLVVVLAAVAVVLAACGGRARTAPRPSAQQRQRTTPAQRH